MTTLTYFLVYHIIREYLFIKPFIGNPRIWEVPTQEEQMIYYEEEYEDE